MMTLEITQVIAGLVDAWNAHDVEGVVSYYMPDYEGTDVSQAAPQRGLAGIRQMVERYYEAFPDLQFSKVQTVIEGNRAALFWQSTGTHRGGLMNIPGTGRVVSVHGVSLLTMEGAKVKSAHYVWDVAGLLRGIGLLPEL